MVLFLTFVLLVCYFPAHRQSSVPSRVFLRRPADNVCGHMTDKVTILRPAVAGEPNRAMDSAPSSHFVAASLIGEVA
jgi:hypothetical protein